MFFIVRRGDEILVVEAETSMEAIERFDAHPSVGLGNDPELHVRPVHVFFKAK